MPAIRQLPRVPRAAARHLVFCLVVAAFLCRALIPAGYMPAANAARGLSALEFCPGTGDAGVTFSHLVDDLSHPVDGHHDYQSCPFCLAVSHAALPAQPGLTLAGLAVRSLPLIFARARPAVVSSAAGPPLGPRAPPLNFA
ncbi:DUF2946 family protein [Castellaniella sp.]|uniref:DUF2946 family protein n=1 Tax=Castellaniella sp. TaxID=1955812 RepID=UPI003A4C763A